MSQDAQLISRLAAQLCEGDEVGVEELRDALLDRLMPMLADPAMGPAATLEAAARGVAAGHTGLVAFPSDAPRIAWTLEENGLPTDVCALIGAPFGKVLGDPLCFECAMLASACVREVCLVANTAAIREGEFDEVMDPVMSALRTAHPDDEEEPEGDEHAHGDACGCGHEHGHDGDACGCGHEHGGGGDCACEECAGEDDEPELAVSVALECCELTSEQLCRACDVVSSVMPDCIVVSTGLGARCAVPGEVRLVAATVEPGVAVRATTDARTLPEALDLLEAGATELACLHAADIVADFGRIVAGLGA